MFLCRLEILPDNVKESIMPWKSRQQEKWGNSPSGIKAMGKTVVDEFNRASKGMNLVKKHKKGLNLSNPRREK